MVWLFVLLAVTAGTLAPVQTAVNARLGVSLGNPAFAAFTNFAVGGAALLVYLLIVRPPLPTFARLTELPVGGWVGGLMGASFVFLNIVAAPRIGVALLSVLVIVGQLVAALVIDHFGLFGLPRHELNAGRVVGVLIVLVGVLIFRRF
ncbi:DMT family transporter [Deinococcus yavapaiensis]|uniref:Transporter family-2 protein n=1 Tax=Deinococcus yavapaiensis KR-236 TaxID=694435 RepID=A0A318SF87_9DEIO|nr:DMT family transporter [Deinococcus yavapaiensis]PYE56457.1 transporter family-2 protein [Deinococcus yavapaiensis KR-236]